MMKRIAKKWLNSGVLASLALVLVTATSNSCCQWLFGQEEEPETVKAMRKF